MHDIERALENNFFLNQAFAHEFANKFCNLEAQTAFKISWIMP